MSLLGCFFVGAGVVGLAVALIMTVRVLHAKRVAMLRPTEIVGLGVEAAGAGGLVATEGEVREGPSRLRAPMSGETCLAYEVVIERKWEKRVETERGVETKRGTERVYAEHKGTLFQITDGEATVMVDADGVIDAEMTDAHVGEIPVADELPATLTFGKFRTKTPMVLDTKSRTVAFVARERILGPQRALFARGRLKAGTFGPTLTTPKGAEHLVIGAFGQQVRARAAKRALVLGYALAILMLATGAWMRFESRGDAVGDAALTSAKMRGRAAGGAASSPRP